MESKVKWLINWKKFKASSRQQTEKNGPLYTASEQSMTGIILYEAMPGTFQMNGWNK